MHEKRPFKFERLSVSSTMASPGQSTVKDALGDSTSRRVTFSDEHTYHPMPESYASTSEYGHDSTAGEQVHVWGRIATRKTSSETA